jgi:membrane protease subunit HflK
MGMEKDDQSTQMPEVSEKTDKFPPPDWKEVFVGILKRIVSACRNLWRKTRSAYTNIFRPEGDVSPLDDIKGAFGHIPLSKKGLKYLLFGFILTIYLLSGVYTVKPGEEAVARIFGKEVRHAITEGLHYRLPWPIEAVEKVNIMEIRRVDVGMPYSEKPLLFPKNRSLSSSSAGGHEGHGAPSRGSQNRRPEPVSERTQFLTGDENILEIRMNIQYRIKDTSDYLFNFNSPDSLVPYAARSAVTEIFGGMQVDNLLTVAKAQLQKRISRRTQKMLDEYRTGLYILNVNLQEVNPPTEVAQAFRDVASAREEREEKINKAQGYWNAVIPEARGNAHKIVSDAEGFKEEAINYASGDAEKFTAMLKEYRGAKEVTEYRLYLETIEKILARAKKFVIDSKKERVNLKFVK